MNLNMLKFEPLFDWDTVISSTLSMTIKKNATTIPMKIYKALGCPEYVSIMFDKSQKIMKMKSTDENDANALKVRYIGKQPVFSSVLYTRIRDVAGLDGQQSLIVAEGLRIDADSIVFCKTFTEWAGVKKLIGSVNLD